uniref:Retinoic acid receptor responder protein 2 n=2 Tax=Nothobranchius korthausae TaxID=1143690 RepID=A0A1A8G4E2_9TELE
MAAQLLLLACAAVVLHAAKAQDSYNGLPDSFKAGVDLVSEQLTSSSNVKLHFRFWKTVNKLQQEAGFHQKFLNHHFLLKPTWCAKGTGASNSQSCAFRNDRPLMDCRVCFKMSREGIEYDPKPYVHCIQRPRLTPEMITERTQQCEKVNYNTGGATILGLSTS